MTRPRPIAATNLDGTKRITQRIIRSRFGYYCHTTHGIAHVGEVPLFSFTQRGIQRKAARLARKLYRDDLAYLNAQECNWTPHDLRQRARNTSA